MWLPIYPAPPVTRMDMEPKGAELLVVPHGSASITRRLPGGQRARVVTFTFERADALLERLAPPYPPRRPEGSARPGSVRQSGLDEVER
jgi:hypothetical protein